MAPNSPACSFIHASMAGSRSTAPLNRSNSVLIIAPLSAFEISAFTAPFRKERRDAVGLRIPTGWSTTRKLSSNCASGNQSLNQLRESAEFGSEGGLKYHSDYRKPWRHLQGQLEPARN